MRALLKHSFEVATMACLVAGFGAVVFALATSPVWAQSVVAVAVIAWLAREFAETPSIDARTHGEI